MNLLSVFKQIYYLPFLTIHGSGLERYTTAGFLYVPLSTISGRAKHAAYTISANNFRRTFATAQYIKKKEIILTALKKS